MTLSDFLRQNPGLSDADAAAAFNALPDHYAPVPAHRVLAWMGEAGRYRKLTEFARAGTIDPLTIALQSAVQTVLLAATNPNTVIETHPGSGHRQLLSAIVSVGGLSADDADALIARGRVAGFTPVAEQEVADARAALARADALDALQSWLGTESQRRHNAAAGLIDAARQDAAVAVPTHEQLEALLDGEGA